MSLHGDGSNNFGRFLSGAFLTHLCSEGQMVIGVFYVLYSYVVVLPVYEVALDSFSRRCCTFPDVGIYDSRFFRVFRRRFYILRVFPSHDHTDSHHTLSNSRFTQLCEVHDC